MERNRFFSTACVSIIVISIVIGILAAVLFSLGLLPGISAALPFIIALAVFALAIIIGILAAFAFTRNRNGVVCCVQKYAFSLLIAASIAVIASILGLALGFVATSIVSQLLVFLIAASFIILIIALFDLIRCIIIASFRLNTRDDLGQNEWRG